MKYLTFIFILFITATSFKRQHKEVLVSIRLPAKVLRYSKVLLNDKEVGVLHNSTKLNPRIILKTSKKVQKIKVETKAGIDCICNSIFHEDYIDKSPVIIIPICN